MLQCGLLLNASFVCDIFGSTNMNLNIVVLQKRGVEQWDESKHFNQNWSLQLTSIHVSSHTTLGVKSLGIKVVESSHIVGIG